MNRTMTLDRGWQVVQDVYDLGERYELYKDGFDFTVIDAGYPKGCSFQMDEWRGIPALAHLQLLLSEDPHYGPEMRLYNAAPWWYRVAFSLPEEDLTRQGRLIFEGVDYFGKVYLNGEYLGMHEGYSTPFDWDVTGKLKTENVLYVKVWSPLEFKRAGEAPNDPRCLLVERDMLKGTYEHGDSLIHRDRNPVGIWRPVRLEIFDQVHLEEKPRLDVNLDGESARVHVGVKVFNPETSRELHWRMRIFDHEGQWVETFQSASHVEMGVNALEMDGRILNPILWNSWDRGGAYLYRAVIDIDGQKMAEIPFGVRNVELRRTEDETTYYLNGRRIYIRGMSYFPETYLSLMHVGRYRRDLQALKDCGCNMVRVHVHQEMEAFYDLCDEMGMLVMQDTDFNWVHPCNEDWTNRMLDIVQEQEKLLHNHPSIVTWVCLNEPMEVHQEHQGSHCLENRFVYCQPGPQVYALIHRLNPSMPIIRGSFCENDLLSGDSHNYAGSIYGCVNYSDVQWQDEKLNTEFGFDAPPALQSLLNYPRILRRLDLDQSELDQIDYYQYRYLKYRIEWFRLRKYRPTSGHIQFMEIDCSPSSYYGVYDYNGCAKPGVKAFLESNQPVGVFYSADSLWVVNDRLEDLDNCTLYYSIQDEDGEVIGQGNIPVKVAADGLVKAGNIGGHIDTGRRVRIFLRLLDAQRRCLAWNRYDDPFHHPEHPKGHPMRFSHTLGLRLYK